MNPDGQGALTAGPADIEKNLEEQQREHLDIVTDQQLDTKLLPEKPPVTPNATSPTSPILPTSPTSQSSDSDIRPDLNKYDSKIVQIREIPEGDAALAH